MPYAKLTTTIPESVWLGEVSRAYPETKFRVLAATGTTATGVTQIEILSADPGDVRREIRASGSGTDVTVFETPGEMCRIQVETTGRRLLTPLQECGVPPAMPVEASDGEMTLEITTTQRTLSDLKTTLDEFDINFVIERVQQEIESHSLLTERQQWLIDEAIRRGYYDTPRRTTLVALSEELNLAQSTCSEILHRAEERILKDYRTAEPDTNPPPLYSSSFD